MLFLAPWIIMINPIAKAIEIAVIISGSFKN